MKKLIIMRGVSGSGKSTLAQELGKDGVIFSTDDYFMIDGEYKFNPKELGSAHRWNLRRTEKAMQYSKPLIVIDNTNTQAWEMSKYVEIAQQYGYNIEIAEPNWHPDLRNEEGKWNFDFLKGRNKHGVPEEALKRMIDRYEYDLTVEEILNNE